MSTTFNESAFSELNKITTPNFDGSAKWERQPADEELRNRPILGITSADYRKYKLIIDQKGNVGIGKKPEIYKMEVDGEIGAKDFIIRGISISDIIREHKEEIEKLKNKLEVLTRNKEK